MADPQNDLKNPEYNVEPGIVVVEGSKYQQYMRQFEQFPSALSGRQGPGNPYTYRPFPKMVYKAERFEGKVACMAAPPDSYMFKDNREYERAVQMAEKFTERCQRIVNNEVELSKAYEAGYRESPQEAVDFVLGRDAKAAEAAAHLNYEDRNLTGPALEERKAEEAAAHARGEHLAEVPEKRRGRPRKVVEG
jgi:hypothetical protein